MAIVVKGCAIEPGELVLQLMRVARVVSFLTLSYISRLCFKIIYVFQNHVCVLKIIYVF